MERLTPEEGLHHPWIIQSKLKRTSTESKINKYQIKKQDNQNSILNNDSCILVSFFIYLFILFIFNLFRF